MGFSTRAFAICIFCFFVLCLPARTRGQADVVILRQAAVQASPAGETVASRKPPLAALTFLDTPQPCGFTSGDSGSELSPAVVPSLEGCAFDGEASDFRCPAADPIAAFPLLQPESSSGAPPAPDSSKDVFSGGVRWKPMLLQSFEFLLIEHGFRLAQQSSTRYLTFHKPFWHDYFASLVHFNPHSWGDGDGFATNYLGHPLQGATAGDIWLQNDPAARGVRLGRNARYWKSRLRAMAWAAVYSVQFELAPILSEPAIGSSGGITYVPGCGNAPCSKPGKTFKPPTNGTGWVDLVVTPTVGMGWIVFEDALYVNIVNRYGGDAPSVGWRVLGSILNPSRSMASFLSGRLPWVNHSERPVVSLEKVAAQQRERTAGENYRFEAGFHYVNLNLPMDWQGCSGCRVANSGFGGLFAHRMSRHFWFDSEVNYFPGSDGDDEKGGALEGLFGIRYGLFRDRWAAYAKLRPGFIHYEKAESYPQPGDLRDLTRFACDLGTVLEYRSTPRSALRLDVGATFVRSLQGPDPKQPPISVISSDYISNQGNLQLSLGYLYRF